MSQKFYTADQHLFHRNIIRLCNRPFKDVDEMTGELIARHNSVVGKNDEVYHLGDVSLGVKGVEEIMSQLYGRHHLIVGNHDPKPLQRLPVWESVSVYKEIKDKDRTVVLFHYPMLEWNGAWRGSYHLHGHTHGNITEYPRTHVVDVGVDVWDYTPVTLDTIIDSMEEW